MTPGVAPPRRAAAACPNSWKPAEKTVTAKTSTSRPGLSNASYVAEASPLRKNTHHVTPAKTAITTSTSSGLNSRAKGDVRRRVRSGSLTAYLNRSASSGLDFSTCGWDPSSPTRSPEGRSWFSTRLRTLSGVTVRPNDALTSRATSS